MNFRIGVMVALCTLLSTPARADSPRVVTGSGSAYSTHSAFRKAELMADRDAEKQCGESVLRISNYEETSFRVWGPMMEFDASATYRCKDADPAVCEIT